jgi:hypothetical protein
VIGSPTHLLKPSKGIKDFYPAIELTTSQSDALGRIESFIGNDQNCFLFKGFAGTGKTTLINGLVKYLNTLGIPFEIVAPTGRAARVLEQKTKSNASTIHRMIYSFENLIEEDSIDGKDPIFYFGLRNNQSPIRTIYIVDESSMISNNYNQSEMIRFGSGYLLKDLMEYVNPSKRKIIFIGDPVQLPPVNSNSSPALDRNLLARDFKLDVGVFELTEVLRQFQTSSILKNATKIRKSITSGIYNKLLLESGQGDVEKIELKKTNRYFKYDVEGQLDEQQIIITRSNATALSYNQIIRQKYFPGKDEIQKNERLIIVHNNYRQGIELLNGSFVKVLEVDNNVEKRSVSIGKENGKEKRIELSFRRITIAVEDDKGNLQNCTLLIFEDLLYNKERDLTNDQLKALYIDFAIRNKNITPGTKLYRQALISDPFYNCIRAKFGYAITCHKAQGGEWFAPIVVCPTNTGLLNESNFRWLYTAITRATDKLYLVNAPSIDTTKQIKLIGNNKDPGLGISSLNSEINEHEKLKYKLKTDVQIGIFSQVVKSLNKIIHIVNVEHFSYRDRYTFSGKGKQCSIDILYNAKNMISKIQIHSSAVEEFGKKLEKDLKKLINKTIIIHGLTETSLAVPERHQSQNIYEIVDLKLKNKDIDVLSIIEGEWYDRYTFEMNGKLAEIDIYFNKKGQPKIKPNANRSDDWLLNEAVKILSCEDHIKEV